jgi:YesN/AraC family two-component response regulator
VVLDTVVRSFELFAYNLAFDGGFITLFALVLFIVFLGYFGVNESRMLIPSFVLQKKEPTEITFTSEETIELEQRIKSLLEKEKLYLDENLSLKRLSESLQISDKKLSAFLNNELNTKFKDYINFYRVAEVKEKLGSEAYHKYTLEAIATECGFNSKASFYRVFKKHTGYSPSQYKKRIKTA